MKSIYKYRVLNEDIFEKIGFSLDEYYFFFRNEEYNENEAITVEIEDKLLLTTKHSSFNVEKHEVQITNTVSIANVQGLYGEDGLATPDMELGIAFAWMSKESSQRNIIPLDCTINSKIESISVRFHEVFKKSSLRNDVIFQIVLYVKKPGKNQTGYAHRQGILLGVLDEVTVGFDGTGSMFPITYGDFPNGPLWTVNLDWIDPVVDRFDEENVSICLNKKHKDYVLLGAEEDDGFIKSPFLREIIASALTMIVMKVVEDEIAMEAIDNETFEDGSICAAVSYFLNTFNWKIDSISALSACIHKEMDKFGK